MESGVNEIQHILLPLIALTGQTHSVLGFRKFTPFLDLEQERVFGLDFLGLLLDGGRILLEDLDVL
jgi:hypothetical protein